MITKKEVDHIAKLARLGLTEKEKEKFKKELSAILDYIRQLEELDISKVQPTSHSVWMENVMREDKTRSLNPEVRKKLVEAAPEKKKGYIKVKAIL